MSSFEVQWIEQGFFDFKSRVNRESTFSLSVRKELEERLGTSLTVRSYPERARWRHTVWWREGDEDYAEAQYFMRLAENHPVLSIGVSIEKGYDELPSGKPAQQKMNRRTWDWPRFVLNARKILSARLPAAGQALGRPVSVWAETRTFVLLDESWYERHEGTASVDKIVEHLERLDRSNDWRAAWADIYLGCDLLADEVDGMSPSDFAERLLAFRAVRDALHQGTR